MTMNKGLSRWLLTGALLPLAGLPSVAIAQISVADVPVSKDPKSADEVTGDRGIIRPFKDAPASEAPLFEDDRPIVAMGGKFKRGIIPPKSGGDVSLYRGTIRSFDGDLSPFIGTIRSFAGTIDPLRGTIRSFEGDIDPYRGTIRSFWGGLAPTQGDLDPMIGTIRSFTDVYSMNSNDTFDYWSKLPSYTTSTAGYSTLVGKLNQMISESERLWKDRITAQTGKTFRAGFADAMLAKHGVDLSKPSSLSGWDGLRRQTFLLEWYDGLMNYSGMDRYDHWMNAVNWTPKLTQQQTLKQTAETKTVIGLVDFFVSSDADVKSKITYAGGYTGVNDPHGAAVISLIVASHDKKGIMGIAPNASVVAYNPFDSSMTASWTDLKLGLTAVGQRGASVVNLSLGVPGTTLSGEWRDVFKNTTDPFKATSLYVIAAGNDLHTQTQNINLKDSYDSTFIVVGSVDPYGLSSSFSNRPGTACLTDDNSCKNTKVWTETDSWFNEKADYLKESGLLMNRFLVAPGENILVSDGLGGTTRMSGTSFAAPLVTGAIALIHDRWPSLKKHPRVVAKIILESAQDLGAPGVDPIYGHGLLDVEASQSPLNFDALKYYTNGDKEVKATDLKAGGMQSTWSSNDMFFTAFEKIDGVERDFAIPLSSRLFTQTRDGESYQEFVYHRFAAWMSGASFAPTGGSFGFSDSTRTGGVNPSGWNVSFRGRQENVAAKQGRTKLKMHSSVEMTAPGGGFGLSFGSGDGAALLAGQEGLQMSSDFDPRDGGANPLLGYASGGAHVATRMTIARGLNVTVGASHQDRAIEQDLQNVSAVDRPLVQTIDPYRSMAATARVDYAPTGWMSVSAAVTRLNEQRSFLGVRSLERGDLGAGSLSDGVTLAADMKLGGGMSLFGSATAARSHNDGGSAMRVRGVQSTAFQAGVAKAGLFGSTDQLRLTVAQPLTVERGYIDFSMVAVVDRETGEKGMVTERFSIGAPERRRYVAEALYGAALDGGRTQLNAFARGELRPVDAQTPNLIVGGSLKHSF